MRRYVLTGAPGSGKTALLRALADGGAAVVAEAATDVIAAMQAQGVDEPWTQDDFCDRVVATQRQRQDAPVPGQAVQVYDRSPVCTLALTRYLGRPVTPLLAAEVARVVEQRVYEATVFLVRPLGSIEVTAARRIGYADALAFEAVHVSAYRRHGYTLVDVPPAPVGERAALVRSFVERRRP